MSSAPGGGGGSQCGRSRGGSRSRGRGRGRGTRGGRRQFCLDQQIPLTLEDKAIMANYINSSPASSPSKSRSSPSKRILSDTNDKENETPQKKVEVVISTTVSVPLRRNQYPSDAEIRKRVAVQLENELPKMHRITHPMSAGMKDPHQMFPNNDGYELVDEKTRLCKRMDRQDARMDEMAIALKDIQRELGELRSENRALKFQARSRMDIVVGTFEIEIDPKLSVEEVIQARHRGAHLPTLDETLKAYDAGELDERHAEVFKNCFCCSVEMAQALRSAGDWEKVCNLAASVYFSRFELEELGPEKLFTHRVLRFNERLKDRSSTPEALRARLGKLKTQAEVIRMLERGQDVIAALRKKTVAKAEADKQKRLDRAAERNGDEPDDEDEDEDSDSSDDEE